MRRPFYATDVPGLTSTAVAQPPAPPTEADPYAEGYAAGRLEERAAVVAWLRAAPAVRLWRQEPMDAAADALCCGEHLAPTSASPTLKD